MNHARTFLLTILAAVLVASTPGADPLANGGTSGKSEPSATAPPSGRVVVLGFDGFDARTVKELMEKEPARFPTFNRLAEQVWARGIARLEEHRAIELVRTRDGGALAGVLFIDMRNGGFVFVQARAVLLATGGGPTMYKYHTPSGDKSCDGMAMALRAGLTLRDMEMVQFHPTGLIAGPDTALRLRLLSPRSEGASRARG